MRPEPRSLRRRRGFSLPEMAVVLAISGIVAAIGYNAISGLRQRALANNSIQMVLLAMQQARTEAFARGIPTIFRLSKKGSDKYLSWAIYQDAGANFVSAEGLGGIKDDDKPIASGPLTEDVDFTGSADGAFLSKKLPPPYWNIAASTNCSFCSTAKEVLVVFGTDGSARLGTNPSAHILGGSFSLTRAHESSTIAVYSHTGTVRRFTEAERN